MSPFAVPAGAFRSTGASRFPDIRHRKEQTMTDAELISTAVSMQERAYVPYSHFPVGAALLCSDGAVFTGCNV